MHFFCSNAEYSISREMSVGVIDHFEMINIGHDYADTFTVTLRPGQFLTEHIEDLFTVQQAG
jgi:hypothetical protein